MPKARQTRRCPGCGQDIYFNIHDQGYICIRDRVKWVNGNTWTIVQGQLKSQISRTQAKFSKDSS